MADPFAHVTPTLDSLRAQARPVRVLRIAAAAPFVAFSRRDQRSDAFESGVAAARARGFETAVRPVGGTFAPLHEGSLVVDEFGWSDAGEWPDERFDRHVGVLADVFAGLGVDARIGEVAGEYCPGAHSINRAGVAKISGTAQRAARGSWLVSSVVQVSGAARLRDVTGAVAAALGVELDLDAIGALDDELPTVTMDAVAAAIRAGFDLPALPES